MGKWSLVLTVLAALALVGCAAEELTGEVPGTRVTQAALEAGCKVDCPKCPKGAVCKLAPCTVTCPPKATPCGNTVCKNGDVCCNASCGICTPPGGVCTQQACAPTGGCKQIALCIQGYTWSTKKCACVPVKPKGNKGCATDADCRLFSDYCTGCDCRALSTSAPDPVCSGPGVRCFADPCLNHAAVCQGGSCVVQ